MKDKGVCKGCVYNIPPSAYSKEQRNGCNFCDLTGKSRLVIERKNGVEGRNDICICYKEKKRTKIKRDAYGKSREITE